MRIGIDGSNIRGGGGLTHLRELLAAVPSAGLDIESITVWSNRRTLYQLPERPWIRKSMDPLLEKTLVHCLYWQRFRLPQLARTECDLLFIPGGNNLNHFRPVVSMSQNLLPFEGRERARYTFSLTRLRLCLLRVAQAKTFRRSDGVIFLTKAAREAVEKRIGRLRRVAVIPHGIHEGFRNPPRPQMPLESFSMERPFRWLYVSIVDVYKHQAKVAEAIAILRSEGLPVTLDLIGPSYPPALKDLNKTLQRIDPKGEITHYIGSIPNDRLANYYREADGFVFASSCETISIILLEAMASGLPIACSNVPPMPEVLGTAGMYFNPENPSDIASAIRKLVTDPQLRAECAGKAYTKSRQYTWERCARETFSFLAIVARQHKELIRCVA